MKSFKKKINSSINVKPRTPAPVTAKVSFGDGMVKTVKPFFLKNRKWNK